jgi:Domain of unknown function (DUF4032)/Lipopolysaccharide kinase (Kdo/WaaP) family
MPVRLQLVARTGHPDFLDLPWNQPLEEWEHERLVEVTRGISRHVVRFVNYDGNVYALKELPHRLALREYRLLRTLADESMPVVKAVGVVGGRPDDLDGVLITRHLEFSLPYRVLFGDTGVPDLRNKLLDAHAQLLARLHLAGFFWGDSSLSNTLFRRDAGALSAYLVDAETGELHPQLTDGQRMHDLMIARENLAGELLDVQAEGRLPDDIDPWETADEIEQRYEGLWCELTRDEVLAADERFRIDERLRTLNELGFDVEEIELEAEDDGTFRLRLDPHVVEPGHHRRRLLTLTGLDAQENQARRMLNDLARYRATLEEQAGAPVPESVAAYRWRADVFEPAIAGVPGELWTKRPAAEVFHEILDHRWFLSEQSGSDVGLGKAVESYVEDVLRHKPDERLVLRSPVPAGAADTDDEEE